MDEDIKPDSPVTFVAMTNNGGDRWNFVIGGHYTAEEMVEKYPHFTGWHYAKEDGETLEDYVEYEAMVTVKHGVVADIFTENGFGL